MFVRFIQDPVIFKNTDQSTNASTKKETAEAIAIIPVAGFSK
jgi:hypothetical protein